MTEHHEKPERKIRFTHDGGISVNEGTSIVDAESGEDILCSRVQMDVRADEAFQAVFHVYSPEVDVLVNVYSLPKYLDQFCRFLATHYRQSTIGQVITENEEKYLKDMARAFVRRREIQLAMEEGDESSASVVDR